jgi:5-methylcytosine-specific restriction endonuclease McrA
MSTRALSFMTYREYLESPRFTELRREAIARDGGRCRLCGSRMALEVHHRDYSTVGTPDELEDLTTLCADCHELVSERLGM